MGKKSVYFQIRHTEKGRTLNEEWLENAVFYEIYPQSLNDTNEDGIGVFKGIEEKLDYIKDLGFTAIRCD